MDKEIVKGSEHEVHLVIENGQVKLVGNYQGHGGFAKVELGISSDYLLDKLAEKIPGQIDDAILAVAKEALKKV